MDIERILAACDHTLLKPEATWEEIKAICDDGMKYHTASVCIPPAFVGLAKEYVGEALKICTVIGFPNGYSTTAVKVFEAGDAVDMGADEMARAAMRAETIKYSVIVVSSIPMLILYPFVQKFFVKGVMIGAVKG